MVERITSILKSKGAELHSVSPDAPAYEAALMMAEKGVATILVIEHGSLLGIVSAKDYWARVVLPGKTGKDVLTREVMTSPVVTVNPEVQVLDALQIMTTKTIRNLPVLENGELVGVVTQADLVRAVMGYQEDKIDQLMKYVGHK